MIRKTLLNLTKIEAAYFTEEDMPHYGLNHYLGCAHNCLYCYARRMLRMSREQWSEPDPVENALELLREEIPRTKPGTVMLCSMTDAYQPLRVRHSRSFFQTRPILEMLLEAGFYVVIQTKSPGVLADLDLFQEYRKRVRIGMTIITPDDLVRRKWEPGAPAIESRIAAIQMLSMKDIPTQVSIEPLLPGTKYKDIVSLVSRLYFNADRWILGVLNYRTDYDVYYSDMRNYLESLFDSCGMMDRVYFKQEHAAFPAPAERKDQKDVQKT